MSLRRSLALSRHEFRILRRDVVPFVILLALPLTLIAFLDRALGTLLTAEGYRAGGSSQTVPGMSVMFSFFVIGFVGLVFFRDHGWGTWDRLRASRAGSFDIVTGKVIPLLTVAIIQVVILFAVGSIAFDLEVVGSWIALALVAASMVLANITLGLAIVAYARTLAQVNAIANLGAVLSAGLGGALVPFDVLPGWAQSVAPIVPAYWAMAGLRAVVLDGAGVDDVLLRVLFLLAFAVAFTVAAVQRFSLEEAKTSWV